MANRQASVDFTVHMVDGEIPEPHSSRGRYREIVEAVAADRRKRRLDCADQRDHQAVYVGIKRAIDAHADGKVTASMRVNKDQTRSVFVEPTAPST